jgi:hypothetical protein
MGTKTHLARVLGQEGARGLADVLGTELAPADLLGLWCVDVGKGVRGTMGLHPSIS